MSRTSRDGKESGFTLIEAIVVSVIVAILAAIAIPTYSGYVRNQKKVTAGNIAQAAATAANVYYRRTNTLPECDPSACVGLLNLFLPEPAKYSIRIVGRKVTVTDLTESDPLVVPADY